MHQQLKHLWLFFSRRRRHQLGFVLILLVLASFAEVISIGAVIPFLTVLTNPEQLFEIDLVSFWAAKWNINDPDQLLFPLTMLFSLAAIVSGVLRWLLLWSQTRLGHAIGADLSFEIYLKTLYQPYSVHISRNSGDVIAAVSQKANEVVFLIIIPSLVILSSFILFVFIMTVFFYIEPFIALVALIGFGSIYITITILTKQKLQTDSERIAFEQSRVIKSLQEGLGGIRDVILDGTQETYSNIYRNADVPLRRARASIHIISGSPRFGIEALGLSLIAILSYTMAMSGSFTDLIPTFGALALCAQRLLPVMQQGFANFSLMKGGQASLRDALELLDQPCSREAHTKGVHKIPFGKSIFLNHVTFQYPGTNTNVLDDINIEIKKGERVGIIGKTGSGKSTLSDILMGLLQPSSGQLRIDNVALANTNIKAWQSNIAHVPQSIFLADCTLAENIAFGIPRRDIQMDKVKLAAEKAQIADFIGQLEDGYETMSGERGVRLSGGQRQRIGIARALYKNASLLVFDEATSSLDDKTEIAVMEVIDNIDKDITIIVIAHRLSTLRKCSRIIELEQGRISTIKTYEMLFD